MTVLSFKDYALEVLPELGGSVRLFTFASAPVFRTVPSGVTNSGDTGYYPLIPFANRIRNGVFSFAGKTVHQPLPIAGHPHSLHGHGWKTAWTVAEQSASRLLLTYAHAADAWAWSYTGEERFVLDETGLTVSLAATNTGAEPMPLSLGMHPWFARRPGTVLTASVESVWLADDTMMPTERVAGTHFFDLAKGAALKDVPFVDNCHTGWKGPAVIDQPDLGMKVTLTASPNCPFLHIYAPVGSDFVCAEPVQAMPDSFNRPDVADNGAQVLAPGARYEISMHIKAEKR